MRNKIKKIKNTVTTWKQFTTYYLFAKLRFLVYLAKCIKCI